jgi:hypothetical protein
MCILPSCSTCILTECINSVRNNRALPFRNLFMKASVPVPKRTNAELFLLIKLCLKVKVSLCDITYLSGGPSLFTAVQRHGNTLQTLIRSCYVVNFISLPCIAKAASIQIFRHYMFSVVSWQQVRRSVRKRMRQNGFILSRIRVCMTKTGFRIWLSNLLVLCTIGYNSSQITDTVSSSD